MVNQLPLRVAFLGSGSGGNATVVSDGETTVVVDCGFSARDVARRLRDAGIVPATISAILLTHEHTDHVRGVDVFARRHAPGCRIVATRGTFARMSVETRDSEMVRVRGGEPLSIGTLEVLPFRASHDAGEPVGYRISSAGCSIGILTDSGVLTPEAAEALAGVDVLGLESNHDVRMLERGPYPAFLKRRIRSHAGHLSNADAAEALAALASDRLRHVFALHRSRTNNTASLSREALGTRASQIGLAVEITIAEQDATSDSATPPARLFSEDGR